MEHSPEDVEGFIKLVRSMRNAQWKFLNTRSQNDMIMARAAEKQVDGWLNHFAQLQAFGKIVPGEQQPLWPDSGKGQKSTPESHNP
jgi:hypothetical protein